MYANLAHIHFVVKLYANLAYATFSSILQPAANKTTVFYSTDPCSPIALKHAVYPNNNPYRNLWLENVPFPTSRELAYPLLTQIHS